MPTEWCVTSGHCGETRKAFKFGVSRGWHVRTFAAMKPSPIDTIHK